LNKKRPTHPRLSVFPLNNFAFQKVPLQTMEVISVEHCTRVSPSKRARFPNALDIDTADWDVKSPDDVVYSTVCSSLPTTEAHRL